MELSILQTLSKYFTDPKFVFMFNLVSSLVEYNEEENIGKKIVCLFLAFLQANYKKLHFCKDSSDSFCLTVRYRRYRRQD